MAARTIGCRQLVELATDYLENALSAGQLSAVQDHLAGCGDCEVFIAQMRVVIALNRAGFERSGADGSLAQGRVDSLLGSFRRRSTSGGHAT